MSEEFEARVTIHNAICQGGYAPIEATEMIARYHSEAVNKRLVGIETQVNEIHQFIQMLSGALDNPMVRAMVPANMRGMIGG